MLREAPAEMPRGAAPTPCQAVQKRSPCAPHRRAAATITGHSGCPPTCESLDGPRHSTCHPPGPGSLASSPSAWPTPSPPSPLLLLGWPQASTHTTLPYLLLAGPSTSRSPSCSQRPAPLHISRRPGSPPPVHPLHQVSARSRNRAWQGLGENLASFLPSMHTANPSRAERGEKTTKKNIYKTFQGLSHLGDNSLLHQHLRQPTSKAPVHKL